MLFFEADEVRVLVDFFLASCKCNFVQLLRARESLVKILLISLDFLLMLSMAGVPVVLT